MKISHKNEGQTIIELDKDDILYVQSTVHDKTFRFLAKQDRFNTSAYDSVKLTVEDNLFIVETTRQGRPDKKVFSETWGFYIEKYN